MKFVVGDDVDELAAVFDACPRSQSISSSCTGGLGPTEDDITRDALTRALGVPMDVDEAIVDRIRQRFARRGMTMPEINRRQAMVPRGALSWRIRNGTAPGLWIERRRTAWRCCQARRAK